MNKLLKTLILILYTSAIFVVSLLIIKFTSKGANFNAYTDKPYDDNIAIVTQVIEKRSSKEETKTDYEKSEYDIHFYIKKTSSIDIKDLYTYVAVETKDGIGYVQSSSGKKMEGETTIVSTIKVSNSSSNEFAINKVTKEDDTDKIIHTNKIPNKIYVKVVYNAIVNEEVTAHEINYVVDYNEVNTSGFENFEYREIESTKIASKEDCLSIKFTRRDIEKTDNAPEYDEFRFSQLRIEKEKLPANISIENIKIEVVGEISNKSKVNTEYFSDYISLFTYEGALVTNIANSRSVKVSEDYKVNKVYFRILVELENGEKLNYNYYVLVSELKES